MGTSSVVYELNHECTRTRTSTYTSLIKFTR